MVTTSETTLNFYVFYRGEEFYTIACRDDIDAQECAVINHGTTRVTDLMGEVVWEPNLIKVKLYKCRCGKARLVSVIRPVKSIPKEELFLIKKGLEVVTISLEEARKVEFCFECKL